MILSKSLTPNKPTTDTIFFTYGVREVREGVREKTITIDILYNILTSLTPFLTYTMHRARTHAHVSILNFRGKEVRNHQIRCAELEKILTPNLTSLPLKPYYYPKSPFPTHYPRNPVTEIQL